MTRPELLRNATVRLAFTYVAVFSLSVLLLGAVSYAIIGNSLEGRLRSHIDSDVAQLMGDYADDGIDELRHDIRERIEASAPERLLYSVQNAQGKRIFDPLGTLPPAGWHYARTEAGNEIVLRSVELADGYRLGVAADLGPLHAIEAAIRHSFGMALLVTLCVGILGSAIVSRRFMARLEAFTRTAERVGSGALSERMQVSGSGDDFDQLAQTINRMLARIEQLVGNVRQVSTSIAHDMRTPLGRIRQRLETLRDNAQGQEGEIDTIIAGLDASLEMFSALLRIAEIESGARRSGFRPVDLSGLLLRLADTYQPVAEEQGVALAAHIAPQVWIEGDAALLGQAVVNLIENALRHAHATRIDILLDAAGEGEWCMRITDNGIGIPHGEHERITTPFYRLDPSRSTPGAGLGLGLVAAIASLHGTTLRFGSSAPGLSAWMLLHGRGHEGGLGRT